MHNIDEICRSHWPSLNGLETLHVGTHDIKTAEWAAMIVEKNSNLRSIEVNYVGTQVPGFDGTIVAAVGIGRLLRLYLCTFTMVDEDLAVIASHCHLLQEFWFYAADVGLTEEGLMLVAQSCRKLQLIKGSESSSSLPNLLSALVTHCPDLHTVEIGGVTIDDAMLLAAAEHRSKLLTLRGTWAVTAVESIHGAASYVRRLQILELDCAQLTNARRAAFTLLLSLARSIKDVTVEQLQLDFILPVHRAIACHCKGLESLAIAYDDAIVLDD